MGALLTGIEFSSGTDVHPVKIGQFAHPASIDLDAVANDCVAVKAASAQAEAAANSATIKSCEFDEAAQQPNVTSDTMDNGLNVVVEGPVMTKSLDVETSDDDELEALPTRDGVVHLDDLNEAQLRRRLASGKLIVAEPSSSSEMVKLAAADVGEIEARLKVARRPSMTQSTRRSGFGGGGGGGRRKGKRKPPYAKGCY